MYANEPMNDEAWDEDYDLEPVIDVEALGTLTLRLAQLLAEEVDLLGTMRVADIAPLQDEKQMLTASLEKQHRLLQSHPELLLSLTDDDRDYLGQVADVFDQVLQENQRSLRVAKDVNQAMVHAVQDAMQEHASRGVYSIRGTTDTAPDALSVSLNNIV